jgi:large subunit ribosomal protein L11
MSNLIKKVMGLQKGSGVPNRDKVGKINRKQALEVVKAKISDLNTQSEEAAIQMVVGTARSMGIDYVEGA